MRPLEIDVRGVSSIVRHPERGVISIGISSQGPSQELVSQQVSSTSNQLQQTFDELAPKTATGLAAPEAAITTFSTSFLRTWSHVPYDLKGEAQRRVYRASSGFEVIFRDFEKLAAVASALFLMPHVTINSVVWTLTELTRESLGAEARKTAMLDAIAKANDYAQAVGREVVAVKISDAGGASAAAMNVQSQSSMQQMAQLQSSMQQQMAPGGGGGGARSSAPDGISLTPEKVVLSGSVQVTFATDD